MAQCQRHWAKEEIRRVGAENIRKMEMKADSYRVLGFYGHCHFYLHFSLSDLHGRSLSLTSKGLIFKSERLLILSNTSCCKNNIWNTIILVMFSSHLWGYKSILWMSFSLASSVFTDVIFTFDLRRLLSYSRNYIEFMFTLPRKP